MVRYITKLETLFLIDHATRVYESGHPYVYIDKRECSSREVVRYLLPYLLKSSSKEPISQPSATERIKPLKPEYENLIEKSLIRSYNDGAPIEVFHLNQRGQILLKEGMEFLFSTHPHLKNFKRVDIRMKRPSR